MTVEWLAILMFLGLFVLLSCGYPVAYTFAGTAMIFGLIGLALGSFDLAPLRALPNRWFGTMTDLTLLAIPYFVFMGIVLEKSGIAEDLLETIGILFGPVRAGMILAVILVGTLLAATTGVVAASVIAMGTISLPIMLRYNYNKELSCGVIAASGTLAQLIPPSLVLVVLSDQLGVSVGDLFIGAIIPGLMLSGGYALYALAVAYIDPQAAPALPPEMRTLRGWALFRRSIQALVPPLGLILIVLGSIFAGIATATEAGAVGAVGAVILTLLRRRLTWGLLKEAAEATLRTTSLVIMILFGSTLFSLTFDDLGGTRLITEWLTNLPGGQMAFLIVTMIIIFLLGIFLEFVEISYIALPLLVPAARELGIDLVWLGILIAINLQTAFLSPPVGFALFYLSSVAPPEVKTLDIYRGVIQFIVIQVVVLVIVLLYEPSVTWLVDLSR